MEHVMRSLRHIGVLMIGIAFAAHGPPAAPARAQREQLLDLSGLAWVEGDTFLAVHDAKNPEENERPRASLIRLPQAGGSLTWETVPLAWPPPLGPASDLESVARIPGTQSFLLVESGESRAQARQFRRVFLVELRDRGFELVSHTELPAPVENVEGAAVARAGGRLVFVFAERAEGQMSTLISWAELQLQPLKLGAVRRAPFRATGFAGDKIRPVSALEVDGRGRLYAASAFDPGDDGGPFTSVIWRIGRVNPGGNLKAAVIIERRPVRVARVDGFKVESLASRERAGGKIELFAGTDDENYGGTLRPLPLQP
jgi:hypothetical protein